MLLYLSSPLGSPLGSPLWLSTWLSKIQDGVYFPYKIKICMVGHGSGGWIRLIFNRDHLADGQNTLAKELFIFNKPFLRYPGNDDNDDDDKPSTIGDFLYKKNP